MLKQLLCTPTWVNLVTPIFATPHNTVALKSLSGKITPKTNLILSPELDGRAEEPKDKHNWLVED